MKYNLPENAKADILRLAKKNGIKKVILFGSCARGDNSERSDIDLAVSGGNIGMFYLELEEEAETLLMFDVVNIDKKINNELKEEIKRDGVILYEEI